MHITLIKAGGFGIIILALFCCDIDKKTNKIHTCRTISSDNIKILAVEREKEREKHSFGIDSSEFLMRSFSFSDGLGHYFKGLH